MSPREQRRLLAVLLAWAVAPLPFIGIVLPPFWLLGLAAAALLWWRPAPGRGLPVALQNAAAVLMVVVVVAVGGLRVGPLRPLGHLLLMLVALRAVEVRDRATMLRALSLTGLLWVAAVAGSTHLALVPYLLASAALAWYAGMWLLLAGLPGGERTNVRPRLRQVVAVAVAVTVLAVPVFVLMPRLRSPWIAAGASGGRSISGFSTSVDLGRVGEIQTSQEVALLVRMPRGGDLAAAVRYLRATAFDLVRTGSFVPRSGELRPLQRRDGMYWLSEPRPRRGLVPVDLELLRPERYLFLPQGTVAVEVGVPVQLDQAGGVRLRARVQRALEYRAWVDPGRARRYAPPAQQDLYLPDRSRELLAIARAATAGRSDPMAKAEAVLEHLQATCSYDLAPNVPRGVEPVHWFLTEGRRGHCEFFAGSMVVLLRHLGIPARTAAGYTGAAQGLAGEAVVRQSNAHAWVEVWAGPEEGWRLLDPTPAEGLPGVGGLEAVNRWRWAWDAVQVTWDRWIITFGLQEQLTVAESAADLASRVGKAVRPGPAAAGVLALLLVALLARLGRGRRGEPPAARLPRRGAAAALDRVVRRLERDGRPVPPAATARWIARSAAVRWPAAAGALTRLVQLAELELYGGAAAPDGHEREARALWREVRAAQRAPAGEVAGGARRRL